MSFRCRPAVVRLAALAFAAGALLALPRAVEALDATRTLSQYVHRIWQVQQGLPQASVYSIVQTHDGYLWLGTQTGLVKFDGVKFTSVDSVGGVPTAGMWVTELVEDEQSGLWIGTNQSGLVALERGVGTRYSRADGLPSDTVQCLVRDRRGSVWVCTPNGLAEVTRGKIRAFSVADGLPSLNVRAACEQPDGTLVVGSDHARIATWTGTRFTSRSLSLPPAAAVQAMACASDGSVWIGTSDGLIRLRGAREERITVADGLADESILTVALSREGSVLAGTKNGFSRIHDRTVESFRPQDGLSQSTVYSLYEDREGSLWAATKHGLNQFLDGRAIPFTESEGLPSNNTGPVLQDGQGTIWIGTLGSGLARFDGQHFLALKKADGLASDMVTALAEGEGGALWVGTDAGLNRIRDGRVEGTWTTRQGLPGNSVRALYRDHAGAIWISTTTGQAVFRDDTIRRTAPPGVEPVLAFGEDRTDQLYAAPDDDSPLLQHADTLFRDHEGLLWVGTLGDGLRLVDGDRISSFSVLDGLFDDVIYGIVEDDHGKLWMACSKGIFSVDRKDLRAFAAGTLKKFESTPYSPLDVLRTIECRPGVQPVVARAKDGRLWFSTIRGLLVIDPNHLDRRFLPPSVSVEDLVVDGERRQPSESTTLAAGLNNVEFGYTGVSFVAPTRMSFRYKLEGFDRDWVDAGPRRQAFYTNLPPGRFRFRVAACNPDAACSEAPNTVAFVIEPRLYQRAWFLPLCIAGALMLAGTTYQMRIRRLKAQFDLVLAERGRIARELHDTLIQGFSGITMGMQALASRLPPDSERKMLEDIVADAGHALREARQSLTSLRSRDPSGFAQAVADTARSLTTGSPLTLKVDVDDGGFEPSPEAAHNVLRIIQEAVLNAVKHAHARTLHVSVEGSSRLLRAVVRDDGQGFDATRPSPAGHFGLVGMKERAAQSGASLGIESAPGQGTTVSVILEA